MSQETGKWLNTMTLIGFTEKRGNAWHYREDEQGDEGNHYPGAIPVPDVLRRLFNFNVIEAPIYYKVSCAVDDPALSGLDDEGQPFKFVASAQNRKGMLADDNLYDLGAFKSGYEGHAYEKWLLETVGTLLDDDLGIGSAGLLRNRAQAWVSVEVPESITTPEGVEFRPELTACTSFDGSLATTYQRHIGIVVCDNTLAAALGEKGQQYKVKHTKYSGMKITNAREALAIVHTMSKEFEAEVASLTAWTVSAKQFDKALELLVPIPEKRQGGAERKREEILNLYRADARCAPWNGTAFGVLQAFNTWNHHFATVRKGVPRVIRNMENVVNGKLAQADADVLTILSDVTKHANTKVLV